MIDPWRRVEYHSTLWTQEEAEASALGRLRLLPAE